MRKLQLAIFAAALVVVGSAQASIISLGPPYQAGSWGWNFHDPESFSYDSVVGVMVAGTTFENPGFTGLSAGWASTYNSPNLIAAAGTSTADLYLTVKFPDVNPVPVVWDFWVYDNGVAKAGYQLYYGGTLGTGTYDSGDGWSYNILDNSTAPMIPVPEATTVIAGALLLLPFGASAVRILRKQRIA